ncbi:MAG: 2Fe-2S iron-sulfur cluster-binding protein [Granulosicoccus sp.]
MKLILEHAEHATELIRVMRFCATSGETLPDYTAGSHLEFDLGGVGKRAYSLVDWPTNSANFSDRYTVAVQQELAGDGGSQVMHALSIGQDITATKPKNSFNLVDGNRPVLLLAGGIGVTPLISMATQLQKEGRTFQLHYTARNDSRMGFADSLKNSFDSVVHFYLDDTNPLNLVSLMRLQSPDTLVYLCGPRGMIDAARIAAIDAGIHEEAIHIELFSTPEIQVGDSAFEVEIGSTGQLVHVAADQSIIEALEFAGIDVMYDCQRGDCGICQCNVISGVPDHRDVVLSEAERASGKVIQICVSRAKSARLILDV